MRHKNFREAKAAILERRRARFAALAGPFLDTGPVMLMNDFIQHGSTTTLEHCRHVAWVSYMINERLRLHAEEHELVTAALLHDFYLYDWHDGDPSRKTHGFTHPYVAAKNAFDIFRVSEKVRASISTHMWPLNFRDIPRSREAVIICVADKYCALTETLHRSR